MNAADILADFFALGVRLRADAEGLRFDAPPGVMSPERLFLLRTYKREVLDLLRWFQAAAVESSPGVEGTCPACSGLRRWRSIHGVTGCATCYPPAAPELVAAWIEPPQAYQEP